MGYNTKIDWCDSSWNPVTGCYHGCDYCYARCITKRYGGYNIDPVGESTLIGVGADGTKIVELEHQLSRVDKNCNVRPAAYPFDFTPTLHRYRLDEPKKWTQPRTIFVCSMADLFGKWVPDEWILEVFRACYAAPQHRYLFLTKNPDRYEDILWNRDLNNMWFGSSYTGIGDYLPNIQNDPMLNYRSFVSVEPLLAEPDTLSICGVACNDWVIVGAETGTRKNKVKPEKKWIDKLARACKEAGTTIFMKESLREIMGKDFKQEFPWK